MSSPGPIIIGITPDTHTHKGAWRYEITPHYAERVQAAGGVPIVLPFQMDRIDAYLQLCHGFVLGGGDDPDTQPFGEPMHPDARPVVPQRQAFELALLSAIDRTRHPVLGICLGMQLMALHHGGRLHQHLPEAVPAVAALHEQKEHGIVAAADNPYLPLHCRGFSRHHQAVADAGRLRVIARSDEATGSLIEAVDHPDPARRFYLGVQWHPERTADPPGGTALFQQLVAAATPKASSSSSTGASI